VQPALQLLPAEGLDWLPGPALLTDGEMARLIAIAVQRLGVTFSDLRRGIFSV
jgi:hypothetical protein